MKGTVLGSDIVRPFIVMMKKFIRELHSVANYVNTSGEIMEVADCMFLINIENDGENKVLMIKVAKQRDINSSETDTTISAIRHPFLAVNSFALRDDIMENCSISVPCYVGRKHTNFMAAV